MSQDPFCQTHETIPGPGYTGLIQGCFLHLRFLKVYKAIQELPNQKGGTEPYLETSRKLYESTGIQ